MPRMPVTEMAKKVAALEAKLNKSATVKGAKVMADIDLAPNTYFLRRPSGIMPLDLHLAGGLPAGGLTYLSGIPGIGKSVLLYQFVAMNQRLYGESSAVAVGLSEAAPDHFFMRRCGVRIRIPEEMIEELVKERKDRELPSFTKEQLAVFRQKTVGKVKVLRGAHGEELLGGILDCFESGCFDIIGLDSISAVLPAADAIKDLDENTKRAAAASLLTRFFQAYLNGTTGYRGRNPTTVIFTAQVRSNPKKAEAPGAMQKYIAEYAPQGAWAAKHGKLLDILLKPGEKDREVVSGAAAAFGQMGNNGSKKKETVQVGKTVKYELLKGKAGVHEGITGEYDFSFDSLTDIQRSIVISGLQLGIVGEEDGVLTFLNPATQKPFEGLQAVAGVDRLVDIIRSDFRLELALRRAVLTSAGIECAYP